MKKILVAVDGSDNSNKALMKAKELAAAFNSEITLIYVTEDVNTLDSIYLFDKNKVNTDPLNNAFKNQAMEVLDGAMEHFKDYNGKVDTLIKKGNAPFKILEVSEEGDYDLIVIGSRGLGPFSRQVMGSVSNKVVNNSKISVLIVK